ncbi:hypothetical protein Pmani_014729 [Petrolisthes manimaculis]|uniref:Uncharacterized protein n=1 Tax=Petrolisthes manimaculis TaxID=1843537 RepID=A0AAE1PTM8_9EUCA|nr:hypothetical protein Pmani_014729 [Petrolisthes manimaculis]
MWPGGKRGTRVPTTVRYGSWALTQPNWPPEHKNWGLGHTTLPPRSLRFHHAPLCSNQAPSCSTTLPPRSLMFHHAPLCSNHAPSCSTMLPNYYSIMFHYTPSRSMIPHTFVP